MKTSSARPQRLPRLGAHPLFHLQTGIAGIRPDADGFARVRIAPQPGPLKFIRAAMPSPKGDISVDLAFADGNASGTITLPPGLMGVFVWKGVETPLKEGRNER